MKKRYQKRAMAAFLVVAYFLFVICGARSFGGRAEAAEEVMIGQTRTSSETPKYLLVKINSGTTWSSSWNDLHYVYQKGNSSQQYVAYCLESHRTSPSGQSYRVIAAPDYSQKTENGLKTIFRKGYPYKTVFGDNGEYSLSATEAQAATQIAIRFWMSYRQACEPDKDYHVIESLNPYKKRVKAADSDAARNVFNAAMWLFKLADSGYSPSFNMKLYTCGSTQPVIAGDGKDYSISVRVSLNENNTELICNYGFLKSLTIVDAQGHETPLSCSCITKNSTTEVLTTSDTVRVGNGTIVTFTWPESAGLGGRTVKVVFSGMSNKADISLIYMGAASSDKQKLYVTRMEAGEAVTADATVKFSVTANPSPTNTPKPTATNTPRPTAAG